MNNLISERNDLLRRLESLTFKYDDVVKEISTDRKEMEYHFRRHSKLGVAKIFYQVLEKGLMSRKFNAMREIMQYCYFDQKC